MTPQEFNHIVVAIKAYYQKENILTDDHTIELWYQALKDIAYQPMSIALHKWVETERWSPTIADLRRLSFEVQNPGIPTWDEAWENVLHALSRYGYYNATEGLDSLDEMTRTVVRRIGWTTLCTSEQIGIERAAFRDIYNSLLAKTKENGQIAPAVRKVIEATQEKKRIQISDKQTAVEEKPTLPSEPREMSSKVSELLEKTKRKLGG